jgi:hypothetical protein
MQIITSQQAVERKYSECAACPKSTEEGCFRAVRIELLDKRNRRLDEIRVYDQKTGNDMMFCSVACMELIARMMIQEINQPTDEDLLSEYKKWGGHVTGFSLGYSKIGLVPSADD